MTSNQDIYALAGKQAAADIPAKVAEIDDLRKRLDQLQTELNHLRMIAAYGNAEIPPGKVVQPPQGEIVFPDGTRKPKGMAKTNIIDVLTDGKTLTANELKIEIAKKHGINYGISTIYANLSRGKDSGDFEPVGNDQWKLAKK